MRVWFGFQCLNKRLTCWRLRYWMFKQMVQIHDPTRKVSLAVSSLIPFFSDICQWNTTSVFINGTPLFNGPYLLTSISVRHPSITSPPMDVTLCVCLSQEKSSWQKKRGCPELWKNGTGQDFLLPWMKPWHPEYLIRIRVRRRIFVCLSHPLRVHLVAFSNRGPRQKQRELSVTASLKDLAPITRRARVCVCVLSSCMSITALSFSSLRKYCAVVAGPTLWGPLCTVRQCWDNGPVIKINLVKMIFREE